VPADLAGVPEIDAVAQSLRQRFGEAVLGTAFERGELSFRIGAGDLVAVLEYLKGGLGFNALNDMIGLDRPPGPGAPAKRFAVLYQLYRFPGGVRVRLAVEVGEAEGLPSVTPLYKSAGWAEREIFDMFGIRFEGHPDLRRIYLPDEFEGHPLRKDFPLRGR
jgi:NADH-quinone oxidoreductase subunit C